MVRFMTLTYLSQDRKMLPIVERYYSLCDISGINVLETKYDFENLFIFCIGVVLFKNSASMFPRQQLHVSQIKLLQLFILNFPH